MKFASRIATASAASLFSAFFALAAPAAHADDYCITNGAQAAHGCGYPSMEQCRAASSGIGGTCSRAPGASAENAQAYHPRQTQARRGVRSGAPKVPPANDD